MSSPKHQHFIPRSYLKNFSIEKNSKYFVEAKLKSENQPKANLLSIRDICVDKNLYTIPNIDSEEKYKLEKYYATEIDSIYPEVYQWLVDPAVKAINNEQRTKILLTTLSLFFRTPKFLNENGRTMEAVISFAERNHQDEKGFVKFKFKNYNLDYHVNESEEVKSKLKIENKLNFLVGHLKDLQDFAHYKFQAGIAVYKVDDEVRLVSSDNPIIVNNLQSRNNNIFDPNNIIQLPLDSSHFLKIMPNSVGKMNTIHRAERDKWFAITCNHGVDENSEDWIFGLPETVTAHLADQKKYGEFSSENLAEVENHKLKMIGVIELLDLVERFGIKHENVIAKIRELKNKPLFAANKDIDKIILELKDMGISI